MLQPAPAGMLTLFLVSGGSLWLFLEVAISIFEKMQAQEILRNLRLPEFEDLSQYFRSLPTTTLVGIGAFAAVVAYWLASRPKAVKPPCDLQMQSEEVEGWNGARRSVIGDSSQLLTHYYDDARTMYEVFRRGFNISGAVPITPANVESRVHKARNRNLLLSRYLGSQSPSSITIGQRLGLQHRHRALSRRQQGSRGLTSAAARLPPQRRRWRRPSRCAESVKVYEGYGQTECTAGCTFTTPGDWTSGHVGAPLPCNLIKLVNVEELNYFSSKGEGEICVKGPNVFKGYLKDDERTAEALDKEGWLHTGDVGKWLPNGTLKIIDRKKHIFKLAQGEYIAPEKIENIYIRSEPVSQIYVHGDSLQAFLVGIVVPDTEIMPGWAKKKGFDGTFADLCKNVELKKAIMEDMVQLGKESGLHSFEQVKAVYIHSEMFSVQNGLLTPTLKAKRPELREYFKKQIEELYSSISI
ncbi:long-chain-fatty-acid--CoA ligase 6 [Sceloporus undulatus]|uniref:long-chain-fatty-acid--CoA ligase 6 n=1 Tax=Sceloporus undulatus TaxID=8520 RepID=UPI001C4CEF39|nr:long-chain-fatty-acid--CoA ligase 6 [Sceloporus undulatus]